MSQLHAELSEQAYDLGFKSIEEAEANGYIVDYEKQRLVQSNKLQENNLIEAIDGLDKLQKELEKAHNEWLREKGNIIKRLEDLHNKLCFVDIEDKFLQVVDDTIGFIKKGEV